MFTGKAVGTPPSGPAEDFTPVLNDVAKAYPGLAPYVANTAVRRGVTKDDRQLEYYAPWEETNPNPGRSTVEIYNTDLKGSDLRDSIALDMLHHLGGTDPKGQPVDPKYLALKQQMVAAIAKANHPFDQEAYQQDLKAYPDSGSYQDWMAHNRADAYIRAYVNPRLNPEWQQPGLFTPDMQAVGDQIKRYIATPPADPQPTAKPNPLAQVLPSSGKP